MRETLACGFALKEQRQNGHGSAGLNKRPIYSSFRHDGAELQRQYRPLAHPQAMSDLLPICRANFQALQSADGRVHENANEIQPNHSSELFLIGSVRTPFAPELPWVTSPRDETLKTKRCSEVECAGGFACRRTCSRGDQDWGCSSSVNTPHTPGENNRKLTTCATLTTNYNFHPVASQLVTIGGAIGGIVASDSIVWSSVKNIRF